MKRNQLLLTVLMVAVVTMTTWLLWPKKNVVAPTTNTSNTNTISQNTNSSSGTTVFSTADLPDRDPTYSFTVRMPVSWAVEYESSSRGLNFFDPTNLVGPTTLDQSQVFVEYYTGSDWKPSTYSSNPVAGTIGSFATQTYSYSVPNTVRFAVAPGYPVWAVTSNHSVTHIRTGQDPYTYFVWHRKSTVSESTFNDIIQSLTLTTE